MTKKLKAIAVQQSLVKRGVRIFTVLEFQRLFGVSKAAATFFLFNHSQSGLFVRLKNGLYALSDRFPSEEEIANRLYQPSYISFEYVLARFGIIPEAVYTLTSATTKPSRRFDVEGKSYEYHTIKREAFAGYRPQKIGGHVILLATKEKALVDTLYFVSLKKRSLNPRLDVSGISKKMALSYADYFHRPNLSQMVREIL